MSSKNLSKINIDIKIKECQLEIIKILSELQDCDSILKEKEQYLRTNDITIKRIEDKIVKMGIVKQNAFLSSHLSEEQIDNIKKYFIRRTNR